MPHARLGVADARCAAAAPQLPIGARLEQVSSSALTLDMGTLYPGLMRLEQQRLVKAEWDGFYASVRRHRSLSLKFSDRNARWARRCFATLCVHEALGGRGGSRHGVKVRHKETFWTGAQRNEPKQTEARELTASEGCLAEAAQPRTVGSRVPSRTCRLQQLRTLCSTPRPFLGIPNHFDGANANVVRHAWHRSAICLLSQE